MPESSVQSVPVGFFDFNNVQWVERSAKGSKFLQAFIPSDRVQDFIEGQCIRGDTKFWVQ